MKRLWFIFVGLYKHPTPLFSLFLISSSTPCIFPRIMFSSASLLGRLMVLWKRFTERTLALPEEVYFPLSCLRPVSNYKVTLNSYSFAAIAPQFDPFVDVSPAVVGRNWNPARFEWARKLSRIEVKLLQRKVLTLLPRPKKFLLRQERLSLRFLLMTLGYLPNAHSLCQKCSRSTAVEVSVRGTIHGFTWEVLQTY